MLLRRPPFREPKYLPVRYRLPHREPKPVTIGIAAICNQGRNIICATDGMLSAEVSVDLSTFKMQWLGEWLFLYSGTLSNADLIMEEVRQEAFRDPKVLSRERIQPLLRRAYKKRFAQWAADRNLAPYDLEMDEVGYLFDSSSHYMLGVPGLVPGTADQAFVGRRFDSDSLLKQAIEQLAPGTGSATIEAESELVQVVRQMVRTDSTLVSPQQPALQERGDQVHPRQELGWEPAAPLQNCDLVLVSFRFQPRISFPASGVDHTAGLNRLLHKTVQAGCRGILDVA